MIQYFFTRRRLFFSPPDVLILLGIAAVIYAIVSFGTEWSGEFHPTVNIDLSVRSLPKYAAFSALRGLAAYSISLLFTFCVGYVAAKFKTAEKILIPMLDILQSIPVLGFLPGLVLTL